MNQIIAASTFLLLFSVQALSQSSARVLYDEANVKYRSGQFDSAVTTYLRASTVYARQDSIFMSLRSMVNAGNAYYRLGKFHLAIERFEEALQRYESEIPDSLKEISRATTGLAAANRAIGDMRTARHFQERTHDINLRSYPPDHLQLGISFYNMASGALAHGQYDQGIDYSLKSLPIFLDHYPNGHRRLSSLYINLASMYDNLGDHELALEYYDKATIMDLKLFGEDHPLLAYNYINAGITNRTLGQDSLAAALFIDAERIGRNNNLNELYTSCYYQLGLLSQKSGDFDQARSWFEKAIDQTTLHLGPDFHTLNQYHAALAELSMEEGEYVAAQAHIQQGREIVNMVYDSNHPEKASLWAVQSDLALLQGDYDAALESSDSAIAGVFPAASGIDFSDESIHRCLSLSFLLSHVFQKSEIYRQRNHQTQKIKDLRLSLRLLRICDTIIGKLRHQLIAKGSKSILQEESVQVYGTAIAVAKSLYEATDTLAYLEEAFRFSERNKSTILSENLYARELDAIAGVPTSLLKTERKIQQDLERTKSAFANDPSDSIAHLEFHQYRYRYDSLINDIKHNYPSYFSLKYQVQTAELRELQSRLDPHQMIISFVAADTSWFIFAISSKDIQLHRTDAGLEEELRAYRAYCSSSQIHDNQLGFDIYRALIAPAIAEASEIEELIIFPDGLLGHLSLESLCTDPRDPSSYLIRDFCISQANSGTLFLAALDQPSRGHRYAGFAPSYAGPGEGIRSKLSDLPLARDEIVSAAQIYAGETFIGKEASEFNFKNLSFRPSILHLAMHGMMDDADPNRSRLVFSQEQDSIEDGDLHAFELYGTNVTSDLTILSACNTGAGPLRKGEGIMNLSRAFLFAGCPNLVISLWQARDLPTKTIITAFLKEVEKGTPKNQALRKAKLEYLSQADPLMAHPANWAALVLVGDPGALDSSNVGIPFMLALLAIVLMLAARRIASKKKKVPS
ncbi:MAG: CHAT domain-containing protein [Saprospiraceae bacterium]|nr:CHAT domain-containing protein [Saprospiraceae bacterium]